MLLDGISVQVRSVLRVSAFCVAASLLAACGGAGKTTIPRSPADQPASAPGGPKTIEVRPSHITPGTAYFKARVTIHPSGPRLAKRPGERRTLGAYDSDTTDECTGTLGSCAVQTFPTVSWGVGIDCNGNHDCEQSTYAPVMQNLPPDIHMSFDPPVITPGQWSTSTITLDDTETAGSIDLSYGFTVASGPGPAVGSMSLPTQTLCAIARNKCPKIEIVENVPGRTPAVVSGSPTPVTDTVIGRTVNLEVRQVAGTGSGQYTLANPEWNIPGWWEKTYTPNGSPPVSLDFWADIHGLNPVFFWTSDGDQKPTITMTLRRADGKEVSDITVGADYLVHKPTSNVTIVAHSERIQLGTRQANPATLLLEFGSDEAGTEGVDFTYSVDDGGYTGSIGMIQLISYDQVLWDRSNVPHANSISTELDNGSGGTSFYQPPVPTNQAYLDPNGLAVIDAPALGLRSTSYSQETGSWSFEDYFMYKPDGRNADDPTYWVPLQRGSWGWQAGATYNTAVSPNVWCLNGTTGCPNANPAANASVTGPYNNYTDFPQWTATFSNSAKARLPQARRPGARWTTPVVLPP